MDEDRTKDQPLETGPDRLGCFSRAANSAREPLGLAAQDDHPAMRLLTDRLGGDVCVTA